MYFALRLLPFVVAWALLTPAPARAQETGGATTLVAGLTVHGHGDIQARPDVAYLTVSVTTRDHDETKGIDSNSTAVRAVVSALKDTPVSDRDIQTESYTVQPEYDYRTTPATFNGYAVTDTIRVAVRDLSRVGIALDRATRAGATAIDDVSFDLQDHSRAECDALALAIADARAKADLMAGAAGVSLGRIISISEGASAPVGPVHPATPPAAASGAPTMASIQPQIIDVQSDATIVYGIFTRH
ncbi:MAG: SIMPL domain-containing protein [Capsulimonadaceae bacterium]